MTAQSEADRLDALRQLGLLDTPPSESFDRFTRMASQIFALPIAAISLTDSDRQWFKSRVGITHDSLTRAQAPCAQVAETTAPLVIDDLAKDAAYADSPLAQSGIRFYAGAPLVTKDGHGLGSLCVLGHEPRTASPQEMAALGDLAAMVMAQIELQHAFGRVDPVSGLPNRFQFFEDLDDLAREQPGQRRFVVLVDLARVDQLNTLMRVLGVGYVESLVREAARTIVTTVEPGRAVYHVAATQFAFLSHPNIDQDAYLKVVAAGLAISTTSSRARYVTTIAIGIVPLILGTMRPYEVYRAAHGAAQDAQATDGLISVFTTSNDIAHRRNVDLLRAFGAALEEGGQMRLVFQPRIDLASRRCVGAEALLRWRHPVLGDVSPAEFIPVIEITALSKPMTSFVLDTALAQLQHWAAQGLEMPVSVNISTTNLEERGFIDRVEASLDAHGIDPAMLELEVTESAVMGNSVLALARLETLSARGVRIAIDDFGTGHSSLAYLHSLPADVVKIDKSFVDALGTDDDRGESMIAAIVALSRDLGLRVVAEGVETHGAADALARLGCDEAQGYVFARPLEADAVMPWMARFNGGTDPVPPVAEKRDAA